MLDILRFLVRHNRITRDEYKAAVGDYPPPEKQRPVELTGTNASAQPLTQKVIQPSTQPVMQLSTQPVSLSTSSDKPVAITQEEVFHQENITKEERSVTENRAAAPALPVVPENRATVPELPYVPKKKTKLKPNFALNIMLIIGVIFVILAGVLFATTQWIYLPPFLRTIVICSVSFVFFAASFVAEKLLKIKKTAVAFYTIGSFFLPTAVLTVGYFQMLGEYLSLQGEGRLFLVSAAFLFLGIACLIGSIKYKLAYFTECFLYCVTGTVIFLVAAFHLPAGIFILILYIYAAFLIVLGLQAKKMLIKESRYSHIIRRIPFFTVLNSLLITSAAFFIPGVDASIGIASVLLSPLFLTSLFRGKKSYAGVFPFTFVLTAGLLRFGFNGELVHFLLLTLLSSTLITIVGCITVLPDGMRKLLRIIGMSLAGLIFSIQLVSFFIAGNWNILMLVLVLGVAVNLFFTGYLQKSRLLLSFAAIPTVTALHGVASLLPWIPVRSGPLFAVLLAVLFFVLLILDHKIVFSPRTITSDCLIILCLFVVAFIDLVGSVSWLNDLSDSQAQLWGCLISLVLLFSVLWVEALSHKIEVLAGAASIGIPIVFLMMYIPLQLLLPEEMSWAPLFTAFFAVFSIGGLLLKYKAISVRRFRIMGYASVVLFFFILPIVAALWSISTIPEVPILLLIVTVYCTGSLLIRTKRSDFSPNGLIHFLMSAFWGASLFSSLAAISQFWLGLELMSMKLLLPIAVAILMVAAAFVLRKRGASMRAFAHLLRVSSFGLTILTVICTFAFNDTIPIQLAGFVYFFLVASFVSQYLAGHAFVSSWIEPVLLFYFTDYLIRRAGLANDQLIRSLLFSSLFIVLLVLGRLLYKRVFVSISNTVGEKTVKLDWLTLSSVLAPFLLLSGDDLSRFLAWILFALYSLSFVGRVGGQKQTRLSVSFASAFFCIAFWVEPFLHLPENFELRLNLLVFILYFVFLRYVIWKNRVRALMLLVPIAVSVSFMVLAFSSAKTNTMYYCSALAIASILSFFLYCTGFMMVTFRKDSTKRMELAPILMAMGWGITAYTTVFIFTNDVLLISSLYLNALILCLTASLFLFGGFLLGKRFFSKKDFFARFVKVGSFGLMLFSLLLVVFYHEVSIPFVFVSALFLVVSYLGQRISGHAFATSWLEPVLLFVLATLWADRLENVDQQTLHLVLYSVLFLLMLGSGHLLHRRVFSRETQTDSKVRYSIDWLSISSIFATVLLFFFGRWCIFVSFLLLAVLMVSFLVRCVNETKRSVFATFAASFVLFAIWAQPIVVLADILAAEWNLLVMIAYFLFLRWIVWKGKAKVCEGFLFASVIFSILFLSISALLSGELFDALFLGISMFLLMCLSFLTKKKKWFILSSVTVICLSIYMTREFWSSIAWWIYLLATGLIIIGLAASNEIMKQKGESLTGRTKKLFKDWE